MATRTFGIRGDGDHPWTVNRILQVRRGGMAVAALVRVHSHRVIGWMAADTKWGVKDVAEAGG